MRLGPTLIFRSRVCPSLTRVGFGRVSLSAGFQRIRQKTVFGGFGLQKRLQQDERIPVEMTIVWGGGLSTSYRGSFTSGDGRRPHGRNRKRQRQSYGFARGLDAASVRLGRPLDATDHNVGPPTVRVGSKLSEHGHPEQSACRSWTSSFGKPHPQGGERGVPHGRSAPALLHGSTVLRRAPIRVLPISVRPFRPLRHRGRRAAQIAMATPGG